MIRHKLFLSAGLTILATVAAACSALPVTLQATTQPTLKTVVAPLPTEPPATPQPDVLNPPGSTPAGDLARTDTQGAVEFVLTPLNLDAAGATLDFDVSMNTHSVDLGWDLAAQSVLSTDTGREVTGQSWPVGSGHHYEGTLSFPVTAAGGDALLEGAATLTLTIRNTDVPERSFTWDLKP
jgi:hypothetical protein